MDISIIFPLLLLIICIGTLYMQRPNSNFISTKKTISVVLNYKKPTPFWANVLKGISTGIDTMFPLKDGSYNVSIRHPSPDTPDADVPETMQNLIIQELLKEPRPTAIICSVPDKKMLSALDIASERDIPVYIVNSGVELIDNTNYEAYIASDESVSAKLVATEIAEKKLDNILVLRGTQVNVNHDTRMETLKKSIKSALQKNDVMPMIREKSIDTNNNDITVQELVRTEVNTNMNVKCVVSIDGSLTENIALAIRERLETNDKLNKIHMISYEFPLDTSTLVSLDESGFSQGYIPITMIYLKQKQSNGIIPKQKLVVGTTINSVSEPTPEIPETSESPEIDPMVPATNQSQTNTQDNTENQNSS